MTAVVALYYVRNVLSRSSYNDDSGEGDHNQAQRFIAKALYQEEPEKKFFKGVMDQLGESYLVQFGTELSTIVMMPGSSNPIKGKVDILLADPESLEPKLAVFLTTGDTIWLSRSRHKYLEAIEAVGYAGIRVLVIPRQDYYNRDILIGEMLDAMGHGHESKEEFFSKAQ